MKKIDKFELMDQALNANVLSRSEFGVYCALLNYYNPSLGYAFPSREKLAELLNVGSSGIKRRNLKPLDKDIKSLEEKGYIKIETVKVAGEKKKNHYYFVVE